jgi:two-component system, chemotaxis family, CheB/CheR fusion protein
VTPLRKDVFHRDSVEPQTERELQRSADRILLEHYSPPAVVIDESLRIRQVRGAVGSFLALGQGHASLSVLKMAVPGLATGLRTAIDRAKRSQKPERIEGLRVRSGSRAEPVAIEVVPMRAKGGVQSFPVLFHAASPPGPAQSKRGRTVRASSNRVSELEEDLEGTRRELQANIQELEAANEELQSSNEEVLSSNEELQSTNEELDTAREELQSTNEEIITVNEELHARNEDLARVNSDLVNLLTNVQIAIVMIDRDLRIRHCTPLSEKVLNILPSDIGRPISHLKPNIDCPMLVTMISTAMERGEPQEQITQDLNGRWYSLKVHPYANIQGAVLVLVDVDNLMREQDEAAITRAIVDATRGAFAVVDGEFRLRYVTSALAELLQLERATSLGDTLFDVDHVVWDEPAMRSAFASHLLEGTPFRDLHVLQEQPHRPPRSLVVSAQELQVRDGRGPRVLITIKPGD